jgi:hypothetical protein
LRGDYDTPRLGRSARDAAPGELDLKLTSKVGDLQPWGLELLTANQQSLRDLWLLFDPRNKLKTLAVKGMVRQG